MSRQESGDDSRVIKMRNRAQLTCEACKKSKIKCDRGQPVCDQCLKRSRQSTCYYPDMTTQNFRKVRKREAMRAKIERLENFLSTIDATPAHIEGNSVPRSASTAAAIISPPTGNESPQSLIPDANWTTPLNWQSIVRDLVDLKAYLDFDEDLENFEIDMKYSSLSRSSSSQSSPFWQIRPPILPEILLSLPPRTKMTDYIAAFFNSGEPNTVVVHAPSFQQQYREFWDKPDDVDVTWLALLLAVCSVGAEVQGQGAGDVFGKQHAEQLRDSNTRLLAEVDSSAAQSYLVEAMTLHVLSYLFKHQDVTRQMWQLFGNIVRLCYQAGYHRDPAHTPGLTVLESEIRRRVWIVVQEIEIGLSCNAGFVNFINPLIADTDLPMNVDDDSISATSAPTQGKSREDLTLVQIQICYWEMHSLLGEAAVMAQRISRPGKDETILLGQRLTETRERLPSRLKWKPLDECIIDRPMQIAHRLRIEMAYLKACCLLYLPYLRAGTETSQSFGGECLTAALEIVQRSNEILSATSHGGRLIEAKVLIARHVHDFNLAAMILCRQLKRQGEKVFEGNTDGIDTSYLRSLLSQTCEQWNQTTNLSRRSQFALNAVKSFVAANGVDQQSPHEPDQGREMEYTYLSGQHDLNDPSTSDGFVYNDFNIDIGWEDVPDAFAWT